MKTSAFRTWLNDKWYQHKEEVLIYGAESYPNAETYFRKYKWWLKSIYQKEMKKNG